jgi:N-acyl-phosphatidylethanolamine-hydrolysing phospholipase D
VLLHQSLFSKRSQITKHALNAWKAVTIQHRSYFFFPTSWKEFELRWLPRFREKRIVYVRLLKERMQQKEMKQELKRYYELTRHQFKASRGYAAARRMKLEFKHFYELTRHRFKATKGYAAARRMKLEFKRYYEMTRRRFKATKGYATVRQMLQSSSHPPTPLLWRSRRRRTEMAVLVRSTRMRWKARSVAAQNRFARSSRNYADRIQRVMNRHLMRATTAYRTWVWKSPKPPITRPMPTTESTMTQPVVLSEYSESSWFCPVTGRPRTSRDATGRFVNPWLSESTAGVKSVADILRWQLDRLRRTSWRFIAWFVRSPAELHRASQRAMEMTLAQQQAQQQDLVMEKYDPNVVVLPHQMKMTWIGHSTCLVQQGDVTILTDPIFSERCSPFQSLPIGVARDIPCGVSIDDLPSSIDFCLISHDHYDHLDVDSIVQLRPLVQVWVVPLGIKQWLHDACQISWPQIIELEWWESVKLTRDDNMKQWELRSQHSAIQHPTDPHPALVEREHVPSSVQDKGNSIWLTCCPAQHWGSRTFFDRNFRLWCSFAVFFANGSKFYFGGDTALPTDFPLFHQIRDFIGGNIDLAAIPIGAYEPSFYMADSHCNPAEAVEIHQRLDVRQSVAIHWGTFALSEEPIDQPPVLLHAARERVKAQFTTIRQGDAITVAARPLAERASLVLDQEDDAMDHV